MDRKEKLQKKKIRTRAKGTNYLIVLVTDTLNQENMYFPSAACAVLTYVFLGLRPEMPLMWLNFL